MLTTLLIYYGGCALGLFGMAKVVEHLPESDGKSSGTDVRTALIGNPNNCSGNKRIIRKKYGGLPAGICIDCSFYC